MLGGVITTGDNGLFAVLLGVDYNRSQKLGVVVVQSTRNKKTMKYPTEQKYPFRTYFNNESTRIYPCLVFLTSEYFNFLQKSFKFPDKQVKSYIEEAKEPFPNAKDFIFSSDILSSFSCALMLKIESFVKNIESAQFWRRLQAHLTTDKEFISYLIDKIPSFDSGYNPKCPKNYLLAYFDWLLTQGIISEENDDHKKIVQKISALNSKEIPATNKNDSPTSLFQGLIILYQDQELADQRKTIQLATKMLKECGNDSLHAIDLYFHRRNKDYYVEITKEPNMTSIREYSQSSVACKKIIQIYFGLFNTVVTVVNKDHHLQNINLLIEEVEKISFVTKNVSFNRIENYLPALMNEAFKKIKNSQIQRSFDFFNSLLNPPALRGPLILTLKQEIISTEKEFDKDAKIPLDGSTLMSPSHSSSSLFPSSTSSADSRSLMGSSSSSSSTDSQLAYSAQLSQYQARYNLGKK